MAGSDRGHFEFWRVRRRVLSLDCRRSQHTDDDGRWEVTVPSSPFLGVHVFARGLLRHLTTRIYLEPSADDPVLELVPADRRETLIANREEDGYRFDIRLQGPGETVFFDV